MNLEKMTKAQLIEHIQSLEAAIENPVVYGMTNVLDEDRELAEEKAPISSEPIPDPLNYQMISFSTRMLMQEVISRQKNPRTIRKLKTLKLL